MLHKLIVITLSLIGLSVSNARVNRAVSAAKMYTVLQRGNEYQIVETDFFTQTTRTLHTFSAYIEAGEFQQKLPASELALLSEFPETTKSAAIVPPLRIALSPDQTKLAVLKNYQLCIHPGRLECFGMSELSILDVVTSNLSVVWKIGSHAADWLPKDCTAVGDHETILDKVAWMPASEALVVSLTGDRYCFDITNNRPLVSVDLTSGVVMPLGSAVLWGISPTGAGIYVIKRVCEVAAQSRLCHHEFELRTREGDSYTETPPVLIDPDLLIYPNAELLELKSGVVTSTREPLSNLPEGELLQFSKASNSISIVKFTMPGDGFIRTQLSSDRSYLVTQSTDKTLWKLSIDTATQQASLAPILDRLVTAWDMGRDNLILVFNDANTNFEVINGNGDVQLRIPRQVVTGKTSQWSILLFDW